VTGTLAAEGEGAPATCPSAEAPLGRRNRGTTGGVETNLIDVVAWIDQTDDSLVYTGRTGVWTLRE
jgi:hypothetical protein